METSISMDVYEATKDMILAATTVAELDKAEASADWLYANGELTARQIVNIDSFLTNQYDLLTRNQ